MSYLYHLEHPDILPLLTSYTYNGVPNFLLPLVKGGDLEKMLNSKQRPKCFVQDVSFYNALSGLASALVTLHEYKSDALGAEMIGYHHDLKPKNVLVDGSRFVLSDFGLSKLKAGEDSRTSFKRGQGHYLAPECEDLERDFSKGIISRASDIWSLGCIMLEVVIFIVGGANALSMFREQRTIKQGFLTTKTFFCGKSINPEVEKKMLELAGCEDMIVRRAVALIRQILIVDFEKRPKAGEVAIGLRFVAFQAFILKLGESFECIRWRIDDPSIIAEWDSFCQMTQNVTPRDDMEVFHFIQLKQLASFVDRSHFQTLLDSLESLLNYIVSWDLSSDAAPQILLNLQHINGLLSLQLSNLQEAKDTNDQATHLETLSSLESEDVHILKWDDCAFKAKTSAVSNATISKSDRFLAVEDNWQITIYALPSGEKVREIKMPDELQQFQRVWSKRQLEFGFSPDEKSLVVCWVRHACAYRVGPDDNEHTIIFTLLTPGWNNKERERRETIMLPYGIMLGTISLDSKIAALHCYSQKYANSDNFEHLLFVVSLTGEDAFDAASSAITIGLDDKTFGFSPDGRQLAISNQLTTRYNKQNAFEVGVLDVVPTGANKPPLTWVAFDCDERRRSRLKAPVQRALYGPTYQRVLFGVWEGRWIAGVWERSKRALLLHDLYTEKHLATIDLSCLSAYHRDMTITTFAGNMNIVGSQMNPASVVWRTLQWWQKMTSGSMITFASMRTNRVTCILQCCSSDCWLSDSGQYALVRDKKEVRVFRLPEN